MPPPTGQIAVYGHVFLDLYNICSEHTKELNKRYKLHFLAIWKLSKIHMYDSSDKLIDEGLSSCKV